MNKSFHVRLDIVLGLVSFIGMVLGIVALTGHVQYPWPVIATRMTVNALTILVIVGKIANYIRLVPPGEGADAIGPFMVLTVVALVVIIVLFAQQHMGALSTLFLIAFCVMGYMDMISPGRVQKQEKPITVEQKTEK